MTDKKWNGNVKCAIVWPKASGESRKIKVEHKEIEEYQYSISYTFEKI
jgi:hypothetical protein